MQVEFDPKIKFFTIFDTETSTFSFNGIDPGTFALVGSSFDIVITLTSPINDSKSYTQSISVTGCPVNQDFFDAKTVALSPSYEMEAQIGQSFDVFVYDDTI